MEWEAYEAAEPFGEMANDIRFAMLAQILWNANCEAKDRRDLESFRLIRDD